MATAALRFESDSMTDSKIKKILSLFATFFKIGAFTFGGGYAMIPLIQKEAAENKKWITDDEMLEIVAIAESTPGPIAINSATFIGNKVAGVTGAAAATLGVVLPSYCIITVIYFFLSNFADLLPVKYAFFGIRAGVIALVLKAVIGLVKKQKKSVFTACVICAAFALALFTGINVLIIIAAAAVAGFVYSLISARKGDKKE